MAKALSIDLEKFFEGGAFVSFKFYKAGSVEKRAASDDQMLRTELIKVIFLRVEKVSVRQQFFGLK